MRLTSILEINWSQKISMANSGLENEWIIVTGASSGLGKEMALQLAYDYHANIVAIARRKEKLQELKNEIELKTNSSIDTICADLSILEESQNTISSVIHHRKITGAILNAGITYYGEHTQLDWDTSNRIINLNLTSVVATTHLLTHHFLKHHIPGRILIVSSMGGLIPIPYQSLYSGTKAFLCNFGEALHHELKNKNITITVLAPGGIHTEMTTQSSFRSMHGWLTPPEKIASIGLKAFKKRKGLYVPGFFTQLLSILLKILPRKIAIKKLGKFYFKFLRQAD